MFKLVEKYFKLIYVMYFQYPRYKLVYIKELKMIFIQPWSWEPKVYTLLSANYHYNGKSVCIFQIKTFYLKKLHFNCTFSLDPVTALSLISFLHSHFPFAGLLKFVFVYFVNTAVLCYSLTIICCWKCLIIVDR
jgi:hypothetical protein